MPEPIISTGAALVGASAWFLNRVLGPSADALGDQLKVYTTQHLLGIFGRAEQLSDKDKLTELPPATLLKFVQSASVSADDDQIRELWAHLLSDAVTGGEGNFSVLIDILGNLSPDAAKALLEMYRDKAEVALFFDRMDQAQQRVYNSLSSKVPYFAHSIDTANEISKEIADSGFNWPGAVTHVAIPIGNRDKLVSTRRYSFGPKGVLIDELLREAVVDGYTYDLGANNTKKYTRVEGILVNMLGRELLQKCVG